MAVACLGLNDEQDSAEAAPPTLARLHWTASSTALAAIVGVLEGLYATRWAGSVAGRYVYAAVTGAAGLAARRVSPLRYPALGWLAGIGFVAILLALLQLVG